MAYGFGSLAGQSLGTGNDYLLTNFAANPSAKSVSFWVKPPPFSARDSYSDNPVLSKPTGVASEYFGLICKSPKYFLVIGSPSGVANQDLNTWVEFPTPAGDIAAGAFICIVWNAAQTWASAVQPRVWVNGYECNQMNTRRVPAANTVPPSNDLNFPWQIGRAKFDGYTEYGQLVISEVALWDRLLKAAEAVTISEGNSPLSLTNGLKLYYPLVNNPVEQLSNIPAPIIGAGVRPHPSVIPAPPPPSGSTAFVSANGQMATLRLYPGQSRIIQFLTPDGKPYPIPTGTAILGDMVDSIGIRIADLTATLVDSAKGMVRVTLPDTTLVRSRYYKKCYADVLLTLNNSSKFHPLLKVEVAYSPTLYTHSTPLAAIPLG